MEKWNEICYILSESNPKNLSEQVFESKVVSAFNILGWKEFKGDLKIRKSFQIGASNRITPDIVIKSDKDNLFVIEVKKPSIPLNNTFSNQLKSYMRILKLDLGILIGEKIQVYYDGSLYNNSNFILIAEIDFKRDSKFGLEFVQIFSKIFFSQLKLEEFLKVKLKKINNNKKVRILKEQFLSPLYLERIKQFIRIDLLEDNDKVIVEKAMQDIKINISDNVHFSPTNKSVPVLKNTSSKVSKPRVSLNVNSESPPSIYDIKNPPDLRFTKIVKGMIEKENLKNWQKLLRLIVKIIINKGVTPQEIKNAVTLKIEKNNYIGSNYYLIGNTGYSLQNVDAKTAGKAIAILSNKYDVFVDIEFTWNEKSNFFGRFCKITNF